MNIDRSTSYKTEQNLDIALRRYGLTQLHYVVVCNRAGRFTAIFANVGFHAEGVTALDVAQQGFLVLS